MAYSSPSRRRTALLASAIAAVGLLTGCGSDHGTAGGPQKVPGTVAPATGDTTSAAASGSTAAGGGSTTPGRTASPPASSAPAGSGQAFGGGGTTGKDTAARSTRCHTSELRATVGRMDPGAGQENFPLVLTNSSGHTCTLRGYPGAAFLDASGRQLGADPKRSSGSPATITLKPGASAWAGLTFSNPGVSGARTAKPASLVVTPPDERDHLTVRWTAGQVPVAGNSSSVFLTVFSPGTAP